jgi:acyl carrier protein
MTPTEFDQAFQTVLEDVLGWDLELGDDDGPGSVEEWDSLAQVRLVHLLETRFDVRLPDSTLLDDQTVASLKRLLREQIASS